MTIKDSLMPIIKDIVQEEMNEDEFQNLEEGFKEYDLDFTENDRKMYLFKVVFDRIREEDDRIKLDNLIASENPLALVEKILEQSRYITHLESRMLETLYTDEDLTLNTANFWGDIDIRSTELTYLIMECIEELL